MNEQIIGKIKEAQLQFHPVVPFTEGKDKLLAMDFTTGNTALTDELLGDINLFSGWVNNQLNQTGALYGIGGYNEHRSVYRTSKVFDGKYADEEPRRLHLGTDIWGKPGTPVMAPLDGIVHSFAFNNQAGDYGATIILSHRLEQEYFFTLYGHLGLDSIKNINEGDRIGRGDIFASFGIPSENGHWPPHLHFQLILDLGDSSGDYPGVCKYSEKEQWLANNPDPDIVLQLNRYLT